jgi:peptide methionine sulfoxide reductase MsrB
MRIKHVGHHFADAPEANDDRPCFNHLIVFRHDGQTRLDPPRNIMADPRE